MFRQLFQVSIYILVLLGQTRPKILHSKTNIQKFIEFGQRYQPRPYQRLSKQKAFAVSNRVTEDQGKPGIRLKHKQGYNQLIWSHENFEWDFQKDLCTNGKSFAEDDHKGYLKEFAKGPCTPVVLIPGIAATKLVVQIDCQVLRDQRPEIFSTCGWTDCSKEIWEVKFADVG